MIIFVVWALAREQKWIITQLPDEVANGVITPAQYQTACSAWAQTSRPHKSLICRKIPPD